jgi:hypothetical protein
LIQLSSHTKLKGNALLYTIALVAVLGILLASFVNSSTHHSIFVSKLDLQRKLIRNCKSGHVLLINSPLDQLNDQVAFDLFDSAKDSLIIRKTPFGLLNNSTITAFHGKDSIQKDELLILRSDSNSSSKLYLAKSNTELGVIGSTNLNTEIHSPGIEIEQRYISGLNYAGPKLKKPKASSQQLPKLNTVVLDQIEASYLQMGNLDFDAEEVDSLINWDSILTYKLVSNTPLEGSYKGKNILVSKEQIVLKNNAHVEHLVLVAPSVIVEESFTGSVQIFATDSIVVGRNSRLNYPSVLCVQANNNAEKIKLNKNVEMNGNVYLFQENMQLNGNALIMIDGGLQLNGNLYCESILRIKESEINGSLFTKKIQYQTKHTLHDNVLMNVKISPIENGKEYMALGLASEDLKFGKIE